MRRWNDFRILKVGLSLKWGMLQVGLDCTATIVAIGVRRSEDATSPLDDHELDDNSSISNCKH